MGSLISVMTRRVEEFLLKMRVWTRSNTNGCCCRTSGQNFFIVAQLYQLTYICPKVPSVMWLDAAF